MHHFALSVGTCRSDSECPGTHACLNHNCVSVCLPALGECGKNAECYGINHEAICECPLGFTGNPRGLCAPVVGCRKDTECPSDKACINERCESPCVANPCDNNSECRVFDHVVECECPPGFVGTELIPSTCIPST